MKVILLKDIRGVGQRHEVKNVSDGYAVNFLFPQKAAEPATDTKIKQFESERMAKDAEQKKLEEQLNAKISLLKDKSITLEARATEKGSLFKSITAKEVSKAILASESLEIPPSSIHLPVAIKTTGVHPIVVSNKNHKVELMVKVTAA